MARASESVRVAREAAKVAGADESDEEEREQAVALARVAIRDFENLEEGKGKTELQEQVKLLKEEVFASRRQRVWMGWHGWF